MKKSFIIHTDSLDVLSALTEAQIAELFLAIRDYNNGLEPKLTGLMKAVFIPFKNQFDRDNEKYNAAVARNKKNGKKGGRPKKSEQNQMETSGEKSEESVVLPQQSENPKNPVGFSETRKNRHKPKKADNDNDSDSDNDNESDNDSDNEKEGVNNKIRENICIVEKVQKIRSKNEKTITIQSENDKSIQNSDIHSHSPTRKSDKIPFQEFWETYDKKVGNKERIKKKWNKLSMDIQQKIIEHLKQYIPSTPDKQFRLNPEKYLNNDSWENEIISNKQNEVKNDYNRKPIPGYIRRELNKDFSSVIIC